jgi:hypothetical protein
VVTVTVGATDGKVLTVPIAALWLAADGTTHVEVRSRSGTTRSVTVKPGLVAKGMVAVTPVRGRLTAGDVVIVGRGDRTVSEQRSTGTIGS